MWGDSWVNFENAHSAFGAETFSKGIEQGEHETTSKYPQIKP